MRLGARLRPGREGLSWEAASVERHAAEAIARRLGLPRAVAALLALRGCADAEQAKAFLDARGDVAWMESFRPSPEMEKAIARLRQAQDTGERVVIYGDYDADGVSGASVLSRYFRAGMGLDAHVFLPSRFKEGYGLNPDVIPRLAAEGTRLIVTTDNGITAFEAAEAASAHGIDLVITDHHTAKDETPKAHAIVHPRVDFQAYGALSGAGVAYVLCLALADNDVKRVGQLLDFACIGTLGDMVPLTGFNRSIVHLGLKRWNAARRRPGPDAMIAAYNAWSKNYPIEQMTSDELGFTIAPLVNAAGRLEHPMLAFDALNAPDVASAMPIAEKLVTLNLERKRMTEALMREVGLAVEKERPAATDPFIVYWGEDYPHGLIGLAAGRLVELFGRPVLLLSNDEHDADLFRGSGRAPAGVHLLELLEQVSPLLERFGGHAQACGLAVRRENLEPLRKALGEALTAAGYDASKPRLPRAEAIVDLAEIDEALMSAVELLEPFGQGNPKPVLALEDVAVTDVRIVKTHVFFKVGRPGGPAFECQAWHQGAFAPALNRAGRADLLFTLRRGKEFRTERPILQLNVQAILPPGSRTRSEASDPLLTA